MYVILRYPLRLKRSEDDDYYFLHNPSTHDTIKISNLLYFILKKASLGGVTVENLVNECIKEFGVDKEEAVHYINKGITLLRNENLIDIDTKPSVPIKVIEVPPVILDRVLITITWACNYRCIHCLQGETHVKSRELSTNDWIRTIKELSEYGIFHLFISGGEPFLRHDILDILKYAYDEGLVITLFTNASLITDNICKELKKLTTLNIQVSIHDINPNSFDDFTRVKGAYERTIRGLKKLIKHEIDVTVATCFRGRTIKKFTEFKKFLLDIGVKKWILSLIMPLGCAKINWNRLKVSDQEIKFFLENYFKLAKDNRFSYIGTIFNMELLQGDETIWRTASTSFDCNLYMQYINILPDGKVAPCDRLTFLSLGNLKEESFSKLINKKEMIEKQRAWARSVINKCLNCRFLNVCGGGCPGVFVSAEGISDKYPDPVVCRFFDVGLPIIMENASDYVRDKLERLLK